MSWFHVIILSIVQGVTEFLPVSSSGHLFLIENILRVQGDMLFFNVILHFASVIAVMVVLWRDVVRLFSSWKLFVLLVLASLPAVVVGFLVKDYFDAISSSYFWIAVGLWFTSLFVYLIDSLKGKNDLEELSYSQILLVGFMQALALVPGVSRSGSTILGGRVAGLSKKVAVKLAFLMSLPVIGGATILETSELLWRDGAVYGYDWPKFVVGFVVCLLVSMVVVKWFIDGISKINLRYFSIYTFVLGLAVLFYNWII